jgi:hypothetical protein
VAPAYWPKSTLEPATDRYGGLVLFDDARAPRLYLIPSLEWHAPDGVLVDRTYANGQGSKPEWGVNLPAARPALQRYELDRVLRVI